MFLTLCKVSNLVCDCPKHLAEWELCIRWVSAKITKDLAPVVKPYEKYARISDLSDRCNYYDIRASDPSGYNMPDRESSNLQLVLCGIY